MTPEGLSRFQLTTPQTENQNTQMTALSPMETFGRAAKILNKSNRNGDTRAAICPFAFERTARNGMGLSNLSYEILR